LPRGRVATARVPRDRLAWCARADGTAAGRWTVWWPDGTIHERGETGPFGLDEVLDPRGRAPRRDRFGDSPS